MREKKTNTWGKKQTSGLRQLRKSPPKCVQISGKSLASVEYEATFAGYLHPEFHKVATMGGTAAALAAAFNTPVPLFPRSKLKFCRILD